MKRPINNRVRLIRLRHLAEEMERVAVLPRGAFDHGDFGRKWRSEDAMIAACDIDPNEVPPCRTRACVAGWAGLSPWFRAHGLAFTPPVMRGGEIPGSRDGVFHFGGTRVRIGRGKLMLHLMSYFGLTEGETTELFFVGGERFHSATEAAGHIRALIRHYEVKR